MYDLKGKVALVTGGAQGIGRGIALELARVDAAVIIADLNTTAGTALATEIKSFGGRALALRLDVADHESVAACTAEAIEHFSRLDVLVNNAGIFQPRLGLETTEEDFERCVDVNLTGIWRMVRAVLPQFRKQNGGRVINIASVGGRRGVDFAPAYCASKAAVINLTQSLAAELGVYHVTVNTVCPGAVATAMQDVIKALRSESARTGPVRALPGPLTAHDIGHAVVFFASDAACNITGQALNVDCGFLMN